MKEYFFVTNYFKYTFIKLLKEKLWKRNCNFSLYCFWQNVLPTITSTQADFFHFRVTINFWMLVMSLPAGASFRTAYPACESCSGSWCPSSTRTRCPGARATRWSRSRSRCSPLLSRQEPNIWCVLAVLEDCFQSRISIVHLQWVYHWSIDPVQQCIFLLIR